MHCPYFTVNQQNYPHWHSQFEFLANLSSSLCEPQPRSVLECAFSVSVLCSQALWERITQSQCRGLSQTHGLQPWLDLWPCPSPFPAVTIQKNCQHPSQSLSTSFSADSPTEPRVIRHKSARSYCWYCPDIHGQALAFSG